MKGKRQKWKEWAENPDNLTVLAAWARAGKTDEQIAKLIGISRSTLSEWKKSHESIREALSTGKEFANRMVENSLYRKALGFSVPVKKAFKVRKVVYDETGRKKEEKEELETIEETHYVEPDTRAIMFFLTNRMPEFWAMKQAEAVAEEAEGGGMICLNAEESSQEKDKIADEEQKNAEEIIQTGKEI